MKRILGAIAALTLLILAGSVYHYVSSSHDSGYVDAGKILIAAKSYAAGLRAKGTQVPASVSLKSLIGQGLLTDADVSGFAGTDVTVNLAADQSRPQEVLIRGRLRNGTELVALADGSVQQIRK